MTSTISHAFVLLRIKRSHEFACGPRRALQKLGYFQGYDGFAFTQDVRASFEFRRFDAGFVKTMSQGC